MASVPRIGRIAGAALVLLAAPVFAAMAGAQDNVRVRVTRVTAVMEQPRGDSFVLGTVDPGTVLQLLDQNGQWYLVVPAPGTPKLAWQRGWVLATAVDFLDPRPRPAALASRRGDLMIRGFGQFGGVLFTARDSFEAILDSPFGLTFGGGGQIVFPSGLFVQADIDRFRKDGFRVLVSGDQLFRSTMANTVTVTPILGTIGFRQARPSRVTGYGGAGAGWHLLEEQSLLLAGGGERNGHVAFHVVGGAEYTVAPFVWLAGEVRWTTVPDGLGAPGIGPVFEETDLGATTFRFKIIVGL
jgi:hypothetical protein